MRTTRLKDYIQQVKESLETLVAFEKKYGNLSIVKQDTLAGAFLYILPDSSTIVPLLGVCIQPPLPYFNGMSTKGIDEIFEEILPDNEIKRLRKMKKYYKQTSEKYKDTDYIIENESASLAFRKCAERAEEAIKELKLIKRELE